MKKKVVGGVLSSAPLDCGGMRHLGFAVSTQCVPFQRLQLCRNEGRNKRLIPANALQAERTRLIYDGAALDRSRVRSETIEISNRYQLRSEAFSRALRGDIALSYGLDDALANMKVIGALFHSAQSCHQQVI